MLTWLQLSGAEEIYFRQFFDRKAMVNDRFKVMWLKGKAAVMQPCNIWEKLSPAEGFYGLVRTERGLGVRILKDGSAEPLIKILAEGPIRVREHPEDLKWWKFEKLSDEEAALFKANSSTLIDIYIANYKHYFVKIPSFISLPVIQQAH